MTNAASTALDQHLVLAPFKSGVQTGFLENVFYVVEDLLAHPVSHDRFLFPCELTAAGPNDPLSQVISLAIGAALGGGLSNVMISLGIALIPVYARLMRGQVLTVKETEYVLAARALGCRHHEIMLRHILPNTFPPLIVLVTLNLGIAILAEAGLSFLGLGIDPPGAAWGAMVSDGYRYLLSNPVLSFAPGFCIILVVLAFNLMGDGLRDALDPRLRGVI